MNHVFAQTFTSTWNLTSDGNATTSGTVSASAATISSGINAPSYSSADGISTNGWSNDGASLNNNEYYQYQVTPTAGSKVRVTGITLNHSVSAGNWLGAVYYSMDGFASAGTQLGVNFTSSSTSQTVLNLTGMFSLTIPQGGSFTIRVYAWESDGGGRRFRNRNVVISGNTCALPTITTQPSSITACVNDAVILSVLATNATTYQWKKNNIDLSGETANTLTIANASASNAGTYTVNVGNSCDAIVSGSALLTVNPNITPTFTAIAPICSGGSLSALPTTSNNSIIGTWSPALNNAATTTYTFTPTVGQCATTTTLTITVNSNVTYYSDIDGDGFGGVAVVSCTGQPIGTVTNDIDCDDNAFSATNSCNSIVNLKLFIEGYYLGAGTMQSVLLNKGVGTSATDVESITVELRNATTYSIVASTAAMLQIDGRVSCVYPTAPRGSFYVVIKSKNAVQTWSANPITVGITPVTYDFSTLSAKAYGNNLKEIITGEGIYGLYSGDINQDEFINSSDVTDLNSDIFNSEFGDRPTDLNGDGVVDGSDVTFYYNNAYNSVLSSHP
jgi:hypothetical protein